MPGDFTPNSFPWAGRIKPWSAALHSKPSKGARTLADLPRGANVEVLHRAQGWLYVEQRSGNRILKGYVSRELIAPLPPGDKSPAPGTNTLRTNAKPAPLANTTTAPRSRAEWQVIARQEAFGPELAQQITRGTAWLPEKGFEVNRQIIAKVYDYYGALYFRNPARFQWAGLARMAGGPFFRGFCDMESFRAGAQAQLDWKTEHPFLSSFRSQDEAAADALVGAEATGLEQGLLFLMQMGRDIFNDLAWQHEAYLAGGLAEIERLKSSGAYLEAWRKIDSDNSTMIWDGNARLLRYEQEDILRKGYSQLQALLLAPTIMSFLAQAPHPWGKSFEEYYGIRLGSTMRYVPTIFVHEVTRFPDRWGWMVNNIWPTWRERSEPERARLIKLSLVDLGDRKF